MKGIPFLESSEGSDSLESITAIGSKFRASVQFFEEFPWVYANALLWGGYGLLLSYSELYNI